MKELHPKVEKTSKRSQVNLANKILLMRMIEENDGNEEKLKDLWKGIKSRGIK